MSDQVHVKFTPNPRIPQGFSIGSSDLPSMPFKQLVKFLLTSRLMFIILAVVRKSGSSSVVERELPKLDVAGSSPVSRSIISVMRLNHRVNHWTLWFFNFYRIIRDAAQG